jgi:hypothetical protein
LAAFVDESTLDWEMYNILKGKALNTVDLQIYSTLSKNEIAHLKCFV